MAKIKIYEYHQNKMVEVETVGNSYIQDGIKQVGIKFANGDEWTAVWNGKRWESQEI